MAIGPVGLGVSAIPIAPPPSERFSRHEYHGHDASKKDRVG